LLVIKIKQVLKPEFVVQQMRRSPMGHGESSSSGGLLEMHSSSSAAKLDEVISYKLQVWDVRFRSSLE
jgi:hypothetical protein